jgi:hypothetical protein
MSLRLCPCPSSEYQLQVRQTHSKMITGLLQQFGAILTKSKCDIEPHNELGSEKADLHVGEILANTTERSNREWGKGVLTLDHVRFGGPAFGDKFVASGETRLICSVNRGIHFQRDEGAYHDLGHMAVSG